MDALFSISLPRQAYTVSVVRDVLGSLLKRSGMCQDCVDDVLLATSEACANAVEHAGAAHHYRVEATLAPYLCEMRISHKGRLPEGTALPRHLYLEHQPLPRLSAESGRGVFLMHHLMDEVDFSEAQRTTVLLRKRLTRCDGEDRARPLHPPAAAHAAL
ncbi:ATP-binding protein [Nocardiopsis sp. CNT312]|uniref:ATP-binding protein n=1 Tax=Nocardiopsis sp. CNT312 TaxID=1137268 RepID=UPI0004B2543A|nr:ATP-binding protein [Nocardiopsis sp. CNT312]